MVFKDGDEVELASRNTKPLTRYFPEVVAAVREQLPERCVLDGELFVALPTTAGRGWSSRRCRSGSTRPKSRIDMLAEKTPAAFVAFDLLALGDTSYLDRPFAERRAALEEALAGLDRPVLPDPHHDRPGRGRGVVPRSSRAPASTASSPSR